MSHIHAWSPENEKKPQADLRLLVVEPRGLEPLTPCLQTRRGVIVTPWSGVMRASHRQVLPPGVAPVAVLLWRTTSRLKEPTLYQLASP